MQPWSKAKYSQPEVGYLVTIQSALRSLYRAAFIAGATVTGGPAGGAAAAKVLATPAGKAAIEAGVNFTLAEEDLDQGNFAMGGLVTSPTVAMLGEAGPELVVPLVKPRKRSARARRSDKKLSAAFKEANRRLRTKNGKLRKGKTQGDIARLAHRLRKKM